MHKIIDISLPISPDMPVYPGTSQTRITPIKSASGTAFMSEIFMTSHAGTHIDAPSHAIEGGRSIDKMILDAFFGECRVLDLTACGAAIQRVDLETQMITEGERILFKTANSLRGFSTFYPDYVYLASEAAEYLASLKVLLIGIDYLSVKQKWASDNTSHVALLSQSIPILEGIDLSKVEAGAYTLCAFPLALYDIDGSPARAVLMPSLGK